MPGCTFPGSWWLGCLTQRLNSASFNVDFEIEADIKPKCLMIPSFEILLYNFEKL